MFRRMLIAAFLLCLPMAAIAKSPIETLKTAQTKLETTLQSAPEKGSTEAKQRRATLEAEAKKLFDFETLAQKALGKNWETGTAAQQEEFVTLFSALVRGTYLNQIEGNSSKGFAVNWGSEDISGETAVVKASVVGKTAEGKEVNIKLVYKMNLRGANWMAYDVVTDDSSLLDTYKDSFNKMFKKEGSFDAVIIKLRAKTGIKAPVAKAEVTPEAPAGFVAPKAPAKPAPVKEIPKVVTVKTPTKKTIKQVNVIGLFFYKLPAALFFSASQGLPTMQESFANALFEKLFASLKVLSLLPIKTI
jgi:phospholipid transport system substrate-binding protein